MRTFISIFILLLLISCQSDPLREGEETFAIKQSGTYSVIPTIPLVDGGQLITVNKGKDLYRARPFSGVIQKVSLAGGETSNLSLPSEGPNAIRRVNAFTVSDDRTLSVFSGNSVHVFTPAGDLKGKTTFYPGSETFNVPSPYLIRVDANHPAFPYDDGYLVSVEKDDTDRFSFPSHYTGNLFALMNLEEGIVDMLPIGWEEDSDFYGGMHVTHAQLVGDVLYYGFQYSPDIYSYDLTDKEAKKYKVMPFEGSKNTPYTGSSDPSGTVTHVSQNISYGPLSYDANQNRYYQVCTVPVPEGNPNFGRARHSAVRVFDENLNLLAEKRFPAYYKNELLIDDESFKVRYTKDRPENELFYHEFKLLD